MGGVFLQRGREVVEFHFIENMIGFYPSQGSLDALTRASANKPQAPRVDQVHYLTRSTSVHGNYSSPLSLLAEIPMLNKHEFEIKLLIHFAEFVLCPMALVSRQIGESLSGCLAFTSLFQMNTQEEGRGEAGEGTPLLTIDIKTMGSKIITTTTVTR